MTRSPCAHSASVDAWRRELARRLQEARPQGGALTRLLAELLRCDRWLQSHDCGA